MFSCGAHLYADTFYGHATFIDIIRTNAGKFYYGFHWRDSDHPLSESEITPSTMFFTLFFLIVKIFLRLSSHLTELSFYIGAIAIGLTIKDFLHVLTHQRYLPIQRVGLNRNNMFCLANEFAILSDYSMLRRHETID